MVRPTTTKPFRMPSTPPQTLRRCCVFPVVTYLHTGVAIEDNQWGAYFSALFVAKKTTITHIYTFGCGWNDHAGRNIINREVGYENQYLSVCGDGVSSDGFVIQGIDTIARCGHIAGRWRRSCRQERRADYSHPLVEDTNGVRLPDMGNFSMSTCYLEDNDESGLLITDEGRYSQTQLSVTRCSR